jgi:hypothetical protein
MLYTDKSIVLLVIRVQLSTNLQSTVMVQAVINQWTVPLEWNTGMTFEMAYITIKIEATRCRSILVSPQLFSISCECTPQV